MRSGSIQLQPFPVYPWRVVLNRLEKLVKYMTREKIAVTYEEFEVARFLDLGAPRQHLHKFDWRMLPFPERTKCRFPEGPISENNRGGRMSTDRFVDN